MFCCFGGKNQPLDTLADKSLKDSEKIKPVISDASSGVKVGTDTLPTSTAVSALVEPDTGGGAAVVLKTVEDSSKAIKTRDIKPPTQPTVVDMGARDATFQEMGVKMTVAPATEEESVEVKVFKDMGVDMVTAGTDPAPSRDELFQGMAVDNTTTAKSGSGSTCDDLFKDMGVQNITRGSDADSLFKDMGTQLVIGGTAPVPTADEIFQGMAQEIVLRDPEAVVAAAPQEPDVFQNMGVEFTTDTFVAPPPKVPPPETVQVKIFKDMTVEISIREPLRPLPNHPPVEPQVAVPAPEPVRPAPSPRDDAFFQHIAGDLTTGVETELDLEAATRVVTQEPEDPFWKNETVALVVGEVPLKKNNSFTLPQEESSRGGMSFLQKAVEFVHDVVDHQGQKPLTPQDPNSAGTTATPVEGDQKAPSLVKTKSKKSRSRKKRSPSMKH